MILPDINLLVYAHDSTSKHHRQAFLWWKERLNGSQMIGLAWVTILGFIRLLTNRRIYQDPFSPEEVLGILSTWMDQPHVKIIHPSDRHFLILKDLIKSKRLINPNYRAGSLTATVGRYET